jgi:proteasome component ECM29
MMEVIERYLIDNLAEEQGFHAKQHQNAAATHLRWQAHGRPEHIFESFIQILTKYVVDRNDTVSASYCSSMGYLLRLASDDRVLFSC